MSEEKRIVPRVIPPGDLQGRFSLRVTGRDLKQDVLRLRDISPFGVGVDVKLAVEKGEAVCLKYEDDDFAIEVQGMVAWSGLLEAREGGVSGVQCCQAGIELNPADIKENTRFFRCVTGQP